MKLAKNDVPILLLTAYVPVPEQTTRLVVKAVVKTHAFRWRHFLNVYES